MSLISVKDKIIVRSPLLKSREIEQKWYLTSRSISSCFCGDTASFPACAQEKIPVIFINDCNQCTDICEEMSRPVRGSTESLRTVTWVPFLMRWIENWFINDMLNSTFIFDNRSNSSCSSLYSLKTQGVFFRPRTICDSVVQTWTPFLPAMKWYK